MSDQDSSMIGIVDWGGRAYEIDWPFELDGPTTRDPITAVVYLDGDQVAELPLPGFGGYFVSVEQVMDIAYEFIAGGGLDD